MKTINKYLAIFCASLMFTSCLVDEDSRTSGFDLGPNIAGFSNGSKTISGITDNSEYPFDLQMEVKGPSLSSMTSDVVLNIAVDPSSTAIEGTHFRLDQTTITLTKGENYLGLLPITLLTDGIMAPVDGEVLYLRVTDANGGNVVENGNLLRVNIEYLCFSNLAGNYHLTVVRDNGADVIFPNELIVEVAPGLYKTESIYRWDVGSIAPDQGFNFLDICNVISVPDQDLAQGFYSNDVRETAPGSYDAVTGTIIINYSVDFDPTPATCIGTYVRL